MQCSTGCLADDELLALLVDEPDWAGSSVHLGTCSDCRGRLDALRSQLTALRALGPLPHTTAGVSTAPDRVIAQDASTASWPSPRAADGSADPAAPSWGGDEEVTAREMELPAAIGKYLVVGRFDRSGQADVFRVVHPQFPRDLVLKLARSPVGATGDSDIIAEGRRLAGLEHPNIVRVHDLDFHEGRPFLVMEYIRARTLTQYAREEKITPRRAAALVGELAGAVAFAHRRGVVYQDIKPANVLIDESGRPRLIDFGLAWQQDAWSAPSSQSEGGTYAYIAPEQARLEPDRVRPLSDIFALGSVLYFLLTGQAPFAASTQGESLVRAGHCDFDRSALRVAGVPRRLDRICLRAMAAEPAARFATAEALASALERWVRRPGRAVRAVGTVAVVIAGALFWRWLGTDPPRHLSDPPDRDRPVIPHDAVPVPGRLGEARPDAPHGLQDLVQVCREDQLFELRDAIPLVTGDKLFIRYDLPRGLHASLFWFGSEGTLAELTPVAVNPAGTRDQLLYPPPPNAHVPLTGPSGTELVLICARRSGPIARAEVEKLFKCGRPLSPLPRRVAVRWDRDEFRVESSRGVGAPEPGPTGEIRDLFDAIRRTSPKPFDFVAGVAFPHQGR
jgi:serine/threonine protein kinase